MNSIVKLSNPKKFSIAELVLEYHGYKMVSNWYFDNEYKKDGKFFKIAHPVWDEEKLRIMEVVK